MFGGKPVTVQMAGGGSKTLTLMPPQQGIAQVGKIVRIPVTSAVASPVGAEQPKLMVVQRAKPPTTTTTIGKPSQFNNHSSLKGLNVTAASTSFDGPATTDAALAALAAEAGLMDPPEPEKETPVAKATTASVVASESGETPMETDSNEKGKETTEAAGSVAKTSSGTDAKPATDGSSEEPAGGLLGGSMIHQKLGLKGGSKFRIGLFGGSPVGPPTASYSYRGGLFGGSKDSPEPANNEPSEVTENSVEQAALNGTKQKEDEETPAKMETDAEDNTENPKEASDNGVENKDDESTQTAAVPKEELKEDSGDALSALASAALDHSKEFKPESPAEAKPPSGATETYPWYTVGFVKGNSFDVHNYYLCDEDTSNYTSDDLPDLSKFKRISLEPGTAYKFKVAAINSVGRGDWSEVSNKKIVQLCSKVGPSTELIKKMWISFFTL